MNDAVADFAQRILDRWKPTHTWDAKRLQAWGADLIDLLGDTREDVLNHALKLMVAERSYTSTPLVADIAKIVARAKKEMAAQRHSENLPFGGGYDAQIRDETKWDRWWTGEGVKFAYENITKTEIGKRAAREGWIRPLWTFLIVERRLPTEAEINAEWLDAVPLRRDMETDDRSQRGIPDGKRAGLKAAARRHDEEMAILAQNQSAIGKRLYAMGMDIVRDGQRLADIANGKAVPPRADYFMPISTPGAEMAKEKANPPSKYADENFEEGRGWKGWTA